jgi:hypothetical protein
MKKKRFTEEQIIPFFLKESEAGANIKCGAPNGSWQL